MTSWCCEKRMKGLKYDNELNILQYILQMKSSFLQKSISIYTFSFAHSVISLYHSSSQGSIWSVYMLIEKYYKSHTTVNNLTKLSFVICVLKLLLISTISCLQMLLTPIFFLSFFFVKNQIFASQCQGWEKQILHYHF